MVPRIDEFLEFLSIRIGPLLRPSQRPVKKTKPENRPTLFSGTPATIPVRTGIVAGAPWGCLRARGDPPLSSGSEQRIPAVSKAAPIQP